MFSNMAVSISADVQCPVPVWHSWALDPSTPRLGVKGSLTLLCGWSPLSVCHRMCPLHTSNTSSHSSVQRRLAGVKEPAETDFLLFDWTTLRVVAGQRCCRKAGLHPEDFQTVPSVQSHEGGQTSMMFLQFGLRDFFLRSWLSIVLYYPFLCVCFIFTRPSNRC